jgi:tRNA A37 threonylcarbamoyladenosine modification protein TsaB
MSMRLFFAPFAMTSELWGKQCIRPLPVLSSVPMRAFALAFETSNPTMGSEVSIVPMAGQAIGTSTRASWQDVSSHFVIDAITVERLQGASDDVVQAAARACERAGARPQDVRHIAVSIGPGGFTSVRIAVTAARMIAEVSGGVLVGVPSALVAATHWGMTHEGTVLVLLASKGETAFVSLWQASLGGVQAAAPDIVVAEGCVLSSVSLAHVLAQLHERGQQLHTALGDEFVPQGMRDVLASAGVLLQVPTLCSKACLFASVGLPSVEPLELAPIYPREPEAVTKWRERRATK